MPRQLITIGVSHYCEKARWALDRAGLAFEETACVPGVHVWYVQRAGGTRPTPVLVDDGRVIADSTDIFDHVQAHPDARWRPWPEGVDGEDARALEAHFDDALGPHIRRYAYHHLLQDRRLAGEIVGQRASAAQRAAFGAGFPLIRALMRRSMRIDAEGARRSIEKVEAVFSEVESRLADGRRYLVGDCFTAADVAFAALGGVAVLHPTYLRVDLARFPPPLVEFVQASRERPAGRFIWRLFEEERGIASGPV